jgi:GNAT superfamily N-acetyltransferase
MAADDFRILRLQKAHRRDAFDCGADELNDYLRRFARQNDRKGIGRAYVAVRGDEFLVRGYYTLACSAVGDASMPTQDRLPRYPVPTVLIARLAVDESVQGQGLGRELLMDAIYRVVRAAEEVGIVALEVLAKGDAAQRFYERYGFASLLDEPRHMFLALEAAKRAFGVTSDSGR